MEPLLDASEDVTPKMFRQAGDRLCWWMLGRWLALAGLIGIAAGFLLWFTGSPQPASLVLGCGIGAVVFSVLLLLRRQWIRPQNSKLVKGPFHFLAVADGLTVEGPFGNQTMRWSTYAKAYRDERFIYLLLSRRTAQVIPLSVASDPDPLVAHLKGLGLLKPTPKPFFFR